MTERSANKLRAIIVDDEESGRRVLRSLLAFDSSFAVIDEAGSASEARRKIAELQPDLVFIGIEGPDGSGMELLRDLKAGPYVILMSAHPGLALRAFDLQADDFLVKPVQRQPLFKSVIRAKRRIAERLVVGLAMQLAVATDEVNRVTAAIECPVSAGFPSHLMIRIRRRMFSIDVNEISWIEGASQYCRVHTSGDEYLLSRALGSLECELDPERFLRVHRSAIVNAAYVNEVRSSGDGGYYVYLRNGKVLRVGRTRRAVLSMLSGGVGRKRIRRGGDSARSPQVFEASNS